MSKSSIKRPPKIFGFADGEDQPHHVKLIDNQAIVRFYGNVYPADTSVPVMDCAENPSNVLDLMPKIAEARNREREESNLLRQFGYRVISCLKLTKN